jgi:hypothetical protein
MKQFLLMYKNYHFELFHSCKCTHLTLFPHQVSTETLFVTKDGINKGEVEGIRTMGIFLLKWRSDGLESSRSVLGSWEAPWA